MTTVYGVVAAVAMLLFVCYCVLIRKKEFWLQLLFADVVVINVGYFLLSVAKTLEFALFANKLAYLGSVFLPLCMFMTILKLSGFHYKRYVPVILACAGLVMFGVICTTGILPWYYKEVSLVFVEESAKLVKVYGVLHPLYMVYLILYFSAMILCILRSLKKNMKASRKQAVLMASIVFGNIAVWLLQKFIPHDFEFLSVSYLFSEIMLCGIYWMMQDYVRADRMEASPELLRPAPVDIAVMPMEEKILRVMGAMREGEMLSARERQILELILMNKKRKEIADELHLSENTIKTYTRNLYNKLGVGSREELYALLLCETCTTAVSV